MSIYAYSLSKKKKKVMLISSTALGTLCDSVTMQGWVTGLQEMFGLAVGNYLAHLYDCVSESDCPLKLDCPCAFGCLGGCVWKRDRERPPDFDVPPLLPSGIMSCGCHGRLAFLLFNCHAEQMLFPLLVLWPAEDLKKKHAIGSLSGWHVECRLVRDQHSIKRASRRRGAQV